MPSQDHKTKDFLRKIDDLISKGVIKNHAEVVTTLNWNKSVMSSVKNGTLAVPQHIYNKFKDVYADQLAALLPTKNPDHSDQDYKDKYIALLEKQVKDQQGVIDRLTEVENVLSVIKKDMYVMAALQQGYQKYWLEHYPPVGTRPAQAIAGVYKETAKALEKILKEGIVLPS